MKRTPSAKVFGVVLLILLAGFPSVLKADEHAPSLPKFHLNGQPGNVTIQDLSGFGTRSLRLLSEKNNQARGEAFIQVYALGVREGDDLRIAFASPCGGMRVTLYRISHEKDGIRYLNMPRSVYFDQSGEEEYREKIGNFREAFWVITFEKTRSAEEEDASVRYFGERVWKLVVGTSPVDFLSSTMKVRIKDFSDPAAKGFFERDAQYLIDRLVDPRRIFLIRLWKYPKNA